MMESRKLCPHAFLPEKAGDNKTGTCEMYKVIASRLKPKNGKNVGVTILAKLTFFDVTQWYATSDVTSERSLCAA